MTDRVATKVDLDHLPDGDYDRYAQLLQLLDTLRLGCRCTMVGGRDFTVTVGKGYATARFWREAFGLT